MRLDKDALVASLESEAIRILTKDCNVEALVDLSKTISAKRQADALERIADGIEIYLDRQTRRMT